MEERKTSELKSNKLSIKLYGDDDLTQDFIDSVDKNGILEAITIKDDGTILSGHRRWGAAKSLGLERVPVDVVTLFEDDVEIEIIIDFNRHREKTVSQKLAEAAAIAPVIEKRAEAKMKAGKKTDPEVKKTQGREPQTRDKVADKTGIGSGTKYEKAKTVKEAADAGDKVAQDEMKKLDAGDTSVDAAHKKVRTEQKKKEPGYEEALRLEQSNRFFKSASKQLTDAFDLLERILAGEETPQSANDFTLIDAMRHSIFRLVRLSAEFGVDAPKIWETHNCKIKFPKRLGISKDAAIEDAEIVE